MPTLLTTNILVDLWVGHDPLSPPWSDASAPSAEELPARSIKPWLGMTPHEIITSFGAFSSIDRFLFDPGFPLGGWALESASGQATWFRLSGDDRYWWRMLAHSPWFDDDGSLVATHVWANRTWDGNNTH